MGRPSEFENNPDRSSMRIPANASLNGSSERANDDQSNSENLRYNDYVKMTNASRGYSSATAARINAGRKLRVDCLVREKCRDGCKRCYPNRHGGSVKQVGIFHSTCRHSASSGRIRIGSLGNLTANSEKTLWSNPRSHA